jgi:hypothetical protein
MFGRIEKNNPELFAALEGRASDIMHSVVKQRVLLAEEQVELDFGDTDVVWVDDGERKWTVAGSRVVLRSSGVTDAFVMPIHLAKGGVGFAAQLVSFLAGRGLASMDQGGEVLLPDLFKRFRSEAAVLSNPEVESLLFVAARTTAALPDDVLTRLAPGVSGEDARACIAGRSESELDVNGEMSTNNLRFVATGDDPVAFFGRLAALLPLVAYDPAAYPGRTEADATGLFELAGRAMMPRKGVDLGALVGFGRWIAWLWTSKSPLPVPVSRVVIRFAFGGRVVEDVNVRDVEAYAKGLRTIRAGVAAAGCRVADDPIIPRVFQLRPWKPVTDVRLPEPLEVFEHPDLPALHRWLLHRRQLVVPLKTIRPN